MQQWAVLKITDGTDAGTVNLLAPGAGIALADWKPLVATAKAGGVWKDSPLADGRRLAFRRFANVIETYVLTVTDRDQEAVIRDTQDLRRLLEQAVEYWFDKSGAVLPVWVEARASCETNSRYALIYDYSTPGDSNPYAPGFQTWPFSFPEFNLFIERGHWQSVPPNNTYPCLKNSATQADYTYGANLVLNPSFETAGGGAPDIFASWTETAGDGAIAQDAVTILHLTKSAKLTSGATSNTLIQQNIAVVAGSTYLFSFESYAPATRAARFEILNITAGGNVVALTSVTQGAVAGWLKYSALITIPAGCVSIGIVLRCPAVNAVAAYFDYVTLRLATAVTFGRAATCLPEVYTANMSSKAQLTHMFYYDDSAATYSTNRIGLALPHGLLPAAPAVPDIMYFGVDDAAVNAGPFNNIVFDFTSAAINMDGVWECWTGAAWSAITSILGVSTFPLSIAWPTGVNAVSWQPEANWVRKDVNGVFGWWVRLRLTAVTVAAQPVQQNRQLYTANRPMAAVTGTDISGDIRALARHVVHGIGASLSPHLESNFVIWTRSTSRGARFNPFINLSDFQQEAEYSWGTLPATVVFTNDLLAPTGRALLYTPAVAGSSTVELFILNPLAGHYYGTFRAMLRCKQTGGASKDISVTLTMKSTSQVASPRVYVEAATMEWLDLGRFTIPSKAIPTTLGMAGIGFSFLLQNTAAAPGTLSIYDLVLIPIDESAIELKPTGIVASAPLLVGKSAHIDSIFPKKMISTTYVDDATSQASYLLGFNPVASTPAQLQADQDQLIGVVMLKDAFPHLIAAEQVYHVDRYLSMRGDR